MLSDGIQLGYIGDNLDVYNTNSSRRVALQTPEEDGKRIEAVRTSKLHQIIDVQTAEKECFRCILPIIKTEIANGS